MVQRYGTELPASFALPSAKLAGNCVPVTFPQPRKKALACHF